MEKLYNRYYNLKVEFKERNNEYFLEEDGKKYIPIEPFLFSSRLYLEIFELNPFTFISNEYCTSELRGKARFINWDDKISLFGCNRTLEHLNISIYLVQNMQKLQGSQDIGFSFTAWESQDNDSSVDEGISVEFFINSLQYQNIERSLEKNLIEKIYCNIEITPNIKGLYEENIFHPGGKRYKVLCDKETVASEKELPETFSEISRCLYKETFEIKIKHKKSIILDNEILE